MFPRGVGNLEEVPQDLVLRCIEKDLQLVDKADDGHQQQQHGPKRSATTAALLVAEEQASASTSTTTTTTSSTAAAASSAAILGLFCKALRVAAQGGIGWEFLGPRDWCRTMMACKMTRATFTGMHEWLGALGYNLIKHPEGFSPAKLLAILMQDPAFSGEAWRTALLTDRVQEQVGTRASRVNLIAMASAADSTTFWMSRLKSLLRLPKMPTGPQAIEVQKIVGILVERGTGVGLSAVMKACLSVENPNSTVGPLVLATTIDRAPRKHPVNVPGKGGAGDSWGKMEVVEEMPKKGAEYLDHEAIGATLVKCGVTSIRTMVMLMGGVAIDELKKEPAKLPKLKGLKISRAVRRGIVKALSASSWFALLGVFRFKEFFKNLFKSIHIVEVLKDRSGKVKTTPDKAKVYLLQALLRSECYPKTQHVYNSLAKAGLHWDKLIVAPLARIAADPLFIVDEAWTTPGFQRQLSGKKVPQPKSAGVESMLCAHGNRRATWHAILDCGEITPTQLLRNIVNLVTMDFPVDRVKDHLFKSIDRAPLPVLLKAYTVLKTTFSSNEVSALCRAAHDNVSQGDVNANIGTFGRGVSLGGFNPNVGVFGRGVSLGGFNANIGAFGRGLPPLGVNANVGARGRGVSMRFSRRMPSRASRRSPISQVRFVHTAPPTFKSSTRDDPSLGTTSSASADEVRVMWVRGVGDKKGQRHQIMQGRTVSTRFGPNTVSAYLEVVRSALSLMMDRLANTSSRASEDASPDAPPRGKVTGVISYSEELSKNVVRSGVPPPLPKYTRVAMWRGETVCLDQMGAGDMEEEIVAGINWCEAKKPSERVDLDLSVMVYDVNWKHLKTCSWQTVGLCIPGIQHSGDVTSAPYPDGGRETCLVNFTNLLEGFPSARYIVFIVHSYTLQKWDALDDASVFVANPRARGSGPGGMAVISAARLTGEAAASIAGYLDLAPVPSTVAKAAEGEERSKPIFGIKVNPEVDGSDSWDKERHEKTHDRRIHFVFTDQEVRGGTNTAFGSANIVGKTLNEMKTSRAQSGAQTLADASAFQAALVCDEVCIVAAHLPGVSDVDHGVRREAAVQRLSRRSSEGRFSFYERIASALEESMPAVPVAGREGVTNYPVEELSPSAESTGGSVVFWGGDLDDWLEITHQQRFYKGSKRGKTVGGSRLILVNVHSAEKGWANDEDDVARVNGATAFEELCQAVHDQSGEGTMGVEE